MPNFARWHGFADYKGYLSSSFKGTSRACHLRRPCYARSTLFISLPLRQTWQQVAVSVIGLRSSPCLYQTSFKLLWCCQAYEDSDTFDVFFFIWTSCYCRLHSILIHVSTKEPLLWFETLLLFVLTGFFFFFFGGLYLFFLTCLIWIIFFRSLDMDIFCNGSRFLWIMLQK